MTLAGKPLTGSDAASTRPEREVEIRFRNVTKTFGDLVAVRDLNLDIGKGELVALLGKTGCGKSTMFNMISGLMAPGSGEVQVMGKSPFRDFDWFRGKMAIVFQNDRLLPWRTAVDNVELGLEMMGLGKSERARTGDALAGKAGPEGARERLSARAVRRHAPARVDLARLRHGCRASAVRRAVLGAGRNDVDAAAQRVRQPRAGEPQDGGVQSPIRSTRRSISATGSWY